MPTFNGERYVAQALESVRREGPDAVEVVVVDDGSTDRTLAIVRQFQGALKLTVVPHRRSGNWVEATNVGLRAATGRWASLLHQDDFWLPGRLAAVRGALTPDAKFLVHPAIFVGPDGRRLGTWRCPMRSPRMDSVEFVERLLVQNFLAIPSPVFERDTAVASGGLDESLWYSADWDLWLRLGSAAGVVRVVDQPLAAFRIHPESQTMARRRSDEDFLRQHTTVLERHLRTWPVQGGRRRRVQRAAEFSVRANVALAAARNSSVRVPWGLLPGLLRLGPAGWRRYFRDSRIVERLIPRLRLRRWDPSQPPADAAPSAPRDEKGADRDQQRPDDPLRPE